MKSMHPCKYCKDRYSYLSHGTECLDFEFATSEEVAEMLWPK